MTQADLRQKANDFRIIRDHFLNYQDSWNHYIDENPQTEVYVQKLQIEKKYLDKHSKKEKAQHWSEFYLENAASVIESCLQDCYDSINFNLFQKNLNLSANDIDNGYSAYAQAIKITQTYFEFLNLKNNPFFIKDFLKNYGFRVVATNEGHAVIPPKFFDASATPTRNWIREGMPVMSKSQIRKLEIEEVNKPRQHEQY